MLDRARANREHRYAAENLSAYIDGELTAAEYGRLERHLAECADCWRDLQTLQEMVALLRRVPLKPAPRSFVLSESARGAQARHRRWNSAFGAMRATTVTIATLLVLVLAGDAALTTGLVSLPNGRAAGEGMARVAPEAALMAEDAQPMLAQSAPDAQGEAGVEAYAETEATSAPEAPAPPMPRENGLGAAPEEEATVEAQVESLTEPKSATKAPQPVAAAAVEPSPAAEDAKSPEPKALAMPVEPHGDEGDTSTDAEHIVPLDQQPEAAWWQAWRSLRVLVGLLAGMLLIALAGTIWTGYKRGTL